MHVLAFYQKPQKIYLRLHDCGWIMTILLGALDENVSSTEMGGKTVAEVAALATHIKTKNEKVIE